MGHGLPLVMGRFEEILPQKLKPTITTMQMVCGLQPECLYRARIVQTKLLQGYAPRRQSRGFVAVFREQDHGAVRLS